MGEGREAFADARRDLPAVRTAAVVAVTCQHATASTPEEIGVYVPQGKSARRPTSCWPENEPDDLNPQRIRPAGVKLHLVQSGPAATDQLCCPSLWYAVDYTLTATGATRGRQVPIPAPVQGVHSGPAVSS